MTTTTGPTVLGAHRVVTHERVRAPGWVAVDQGRVVEVGTGTPSGPVHDLGPVTIAPGFVDLHCHGGNGHSYSEGADAALQALLAHRRHGTTPTVASLATDTLESLARQIRGVAPRGAADELRGVGLDGPWPWGTRVGAHARSRWRGPEPAEVSRLL